MECHSARIEITSDAIIHTQKVTKRRGRVGSEAFDLGETRPAVMANNVRWTMVVFYILETDSL